MFWALTLDKPTTSKLFEILEYFIGDDLTEKYGDWATFGYHITIVHESHQDFDLYSRILKNFQGHEVAFKITHLGISEDAIAFGVDVGSLNSRPHITMLIKPGRPPKASNRITRWDKVYVKETFVGTLGEFL